MSLRALPHCKPASVWAEPCVLAHGNIMAQAPESSLSIIWPGQVHKKKKASSAFHMRADASKTPRDRKICHKAKGT